MVSPKGSAPRERRYNPAIVLTEEEVRRFLKCTRGSGWPGSRRYYVLFCLLANAGLRIGEALLLRARHLDAERNVLKVQTLKRRRRRPKKGRPAWRPELEERQLHPQVTEILGAFIRKRRLGPEERLFPMTRESAWEACQRYARLAGLPGGVSLHSFRHFAGTREYEITGDIRWVSYRLRHKALSSTSHYAKVTPAREAATVQKIGAVT